MRPARVGIWTGDGGGLGRSERRIWQEGSGKGNVLVRRASGQRGGGGAAYHGAGWVGGVARCDVMWARREAVKQHASGMYPCRSGAAGSYA
eukprot:16381-Chlamydomonas_euryale.AAC.1